MNIGNVGFKIKQLRIKRKLTQTQLGDILGVTDKAISKWEVGSSWPNIDMIVAISNFFHVSLDFLLRDTKEMMTVGSNRLIRGSKSIERTSDCDEFDIDIRFTSSSSIHSTAPNPYKLSSEEKSFIVSNLSYFLEIIEGINQGLYKNELLVKKIREMFESEEMHSLTNGYILDELVKIHDLIRNTSPNNLNQAKDRILNLRSKLTNN